VAVDQWRVAFAPGDVVVVTINHRINVFGFCHLGMVFDNICRMVNDPGSKERKFWQSL
jgi:carboxylesterase type B